MNHFKTDVKSSLIALQRARLALAGWCAPLPVCIGARGTFNPTVKFNRPLSLNLLSLQALYSAVACLKIKGRD